MPTATCSGCGRATNSATSNYWQMGGKPTECYAACVDGKWVEGCAIDKTDEFIADFARRLIRDRSEVPRA